ncbi:MAG: NYN domain-containing protein [Bdellovibrionales bacterium]|nr:NYN domain-containing protein [Bdellovibrionales bacterium]
MSKSDFKEIRKGVVKRKKKRVLGVFIDGTGLDRATRRMQKRVDMPKLVRGVAAGSIPVVARYYTLIPYEDDSRQRAFLDAVRRAGLQVVVKRLPPKGITRQVSVDTEMAADILAFGMGKNTFEDIGFELTEAVGSDSRSTGNSRPIGRGASPAPQKAGSIVPLRLAGTPEDHSSDDQMNGGKGKSHQETEELSLTAPVEEDGDRNEERIVTVVCPGRDLNYPFTLLKSMSIETVSADFGQASGKELLKSVAKWIDLSDSETIWRDD